MAPGEEENLELEEEEEDAAAGAGSTDAFPPRAPGTVRLSLTVHPPRHVVLSLKRRLTACLLVFSVGAAHGFIAHSCLPHVQLRKVQLYGRARNDGVGGLCCMARGLL